MEKRTFMGMDEKTLGIVIVAMVVGTLGFFLIKRDIKKNKETIE
jgi:ABC-type transport system involved in cytochrome c biogenesis permease component